MRKHCRSRVRTRGKKVLTAYNRMVALFGYWQKSQRWREWTFRSVSQRQADLLVFTGEAEKVERWKDGRVQCVGIRAKTPTMCQRPSATSLTDATLHAVGLSVRDQLTRREQQELDKYHVWPLVADTKAPLVRGKVSEAEIARGLEVFRRMAAGRQGVGRADVQKIAA